MKISITYQYETARRGKVIHSVIPYSPQDAENICQRVVNVGYKLLDVTIQGALDKDTVFNYFNEFLIQLNPGHDVTLNVK